MFNAYKALYKAQEEEARNRRWFFESFISRAQQATPNKSIEAMCREAEYAWGIINK